MLQLKAPPQNILGDYSLTGSTRTELTPGARLNTWILSANAWVDLMTTQEPFGGPVLLRDDGVHVKPLYVPALLVFEGVREVGFSLLNPQPAEAPSEDVHKRLVALKAELSGQGFSIEEIKAAGMHFAHEQRTQISYQEFLEELETSDGIQEAHNCCPNLFHVSFLHDRDLQFTISYDTVTVSLGSTGLN